MMAFVPISNGKSRDFQGHSCADVVLGLPHRLFPFPFTEGKTSSIPLRNPLTPQLSSLN
jgi:hypothetical protein